MYSEEELVKESVYDVCKELEFEYVLSSDPKKKSYFIKTVNGNEIKVIEGGYACEIILNDEQLTRYAPKHNIGAMLDFMIGILNRKK